MAVRDFNLSRDNDVETSSKNVRSGWSLRAANIVIASQLAYGAVSYMETVSFCGQTCHTVMQPEFTAYQS